MTAEGDVDRRTRCWALGIMAHEVATEMVDAADAARADHPTRMGVPIQPPEVQKAVDEANRQRIIYWAREFDRVLTQSESCGIERNGDLGGEFGTVADWVGDPDVMSLASRAQDLAKVVHDDAVYEVAGRPE